MANVDSLRSIMDEIIKFKDKLGKKKEVGSYLTRSSISKATKDIIASFPVLCSDTISPPTASMVAKATERNCVVMLQLLFSSAYLKGESGREVLSQWHTNMDTDMNMDDLLDVMSSFGEGANTLTDQEFNSLIREMAPLISEYQQSMNVVYPISSFSEAGINSYIVSEDAIGNTQVTQLVVQEKVIKRVQPDGSIIFDYDDSDEFKLPQGGSQKPGIGSLNNFLNNNPNLNSSDYFSIVGGNLQGDKLNADIYAMNRKFKNEEIAQAYMQAYNQASYDLNKERHELSKEEFEERKREFAKRYELDLRAAESLDAYRKEQLKNEKEKNIADRAHKDALIDQQRLEYLGRMADLDRKYELDKEKFDYQKQRDRIQDKKDAYRQQQSDMRDDTDFFHKQLLSTDVKKYNELVPSLIVVRFQAVDPEDPRNHRPDSQCIIGVKTRLIPVDSFDIINHVRSVEKNKVSLVNLIRATTKEISFCKDFVAAIDQAKIDARQNSRLSKSSPIWRSLQNRSSRSVFKRLSKRRANDAGAITTLVVSIEEVNALKKDYDIDLTNSAKAKWFMEQYNLLSFVIVDEQLEVARFLYDGEKYFQDYSFGVLERETGDNSYKKVINLISKINRG